MTTPAEPRTEERLEVRAPIFIEILAGVGGDRDVILCNSMDISAKGVQVVVDERIEQGSICRICVDLPGTDPVFLVGEVMWQRLDESIDATRVGFRLLEGDGTDFSRWGTLVRGLPGEAAE